MPEVLVAAALFAFTLHQPVSAEFLRERSDVIHGIGVFAMKEDAVNHGPFYRSAELVASVQRAEDGIFDGFRAAHAVGRIYAGTFTATPEAKSLSRASHFQGTPVAVTVRLSGSSGDPGK